MAKRPKKPRTARKKAKKTTDAKPLPPKSYFASAHPGKKKEISEGFAKGIMELESCLKLPVWLLCQDGDDANHWDGITRIVKESLFESRFDHENELKRGQKIALVIDSQGGHARAAYEIATLLQKHCEGFIAVIPRRAKSAATLISLGADEIVLGEYGELGPLDVQFFDQEREEWASGLDEVQSLERLHAFTLSALDQTMFMLRSRTRMKSATVIPHATKLVTQMVQPMFANVDVFRYTQISRRLKIGEEYARRLLLRRFTTLEANDIARKLVDNYPEHGFIIDHQEAEKIGLKPMSTYPKLRDILCNLARQMPEVTAIGRMIKKG